MDRTKNITKPVTQAISALALALLAACGGGGGETAVNEPAPLATSAATTTLCGVQPSPTVGAPAHTISNNQTMLVNGLEARISLVTSPTGYPFDGEAVNLNLPLNDLRETPFLGYNPDNTPNSMGVELGSRFAPGAVACIGSVNRAINIGTDLSPNFLVSWGSVTLPSVPLSGLPTQAINGFEFLTNVLPTQASAVFRMVKTAQADPATVRICHIDRDAATTCHAPSVTQDSLHWIFRLDITEQGVYILSAPREEVPLE
jgi:hypothetical protein